MMLETRTFQLKLICANCGVVSIYEIPHRRVFIDFHPAGPNMYGEMEDQQWSGYERANGGDYHSMLCRNCTMPMLVRAPFNLFNAPLTPDGSPKVV